jgi:acyl carrier protein
VAKRASCVYTQNQLNRVQFYGTTTTPAARLVEDLGADSLDFVELIMRFEEEFKIEISDKDACKLQRVSEVYHYIEQHTMNKKRNH